MVWCKRAVKAICFIVIFAVIYLLVFNALYQEDPETATMVGGFYQQDKKTNDVVYIGSSAAYSYFNTPLAFHEYGFSSYNFCSGAQPLSAAKHLIKEAEKTQDPSLYIVDLRQVTSEIDDPMYIRRVTSYMPWSLNRVSAVLNMTKYLVETDNSNIWDYLFVYPYFHENWSSKLTEISGSFSQTIHDMFYSEWSRQPNIFRLKRQDEVGSSPYVHKGFLNTWYDAYDWKAGLNIDRSMYTQPASALPAKQEQVLRDLCEYCLTLDKPVLFVSSPSVFWPEYYGQLNYAYEIIASYGFEYVDGNAAMDEMGLITDEDWYEGGHLNNYGAAKYTRYLSEYLVANYDLPDHRSDPAYAAWEEAYQVERTFNLKGATLLFHQLNTISDGGYDAVLLWSNVNPAEKERTALETLGAGQIQPASGLVVRIEDGCAVEVLTGQRAETLFTYGTLAADGAGCAASVNGVEYAAPAAGALCIVYRSDTGEVLSSISFNPDMIRGVMSSLAPPLQDIVFTGDLEELLGDGWQEASALEPLAYWTDRITENFGFYPNDGSIYADCVLALDGNDCTGQTVYVEFKNSDGMFRTYPMETVRREDWAELMGSELYTLGGAGVHIPCEDLPPGEYSVRLFREKDGVILYSGTTYSAVVN